MKQLGEHDISKIYTEHALAKMEDQRTQKAWPDEFSLHAAADAVNTGLTTAKENSIFYALNFNDRVNRLSYSPFNEYFIIGAMARMNRYDEAISAVKDCWGGQINYGGTSTFEVYRPSWNNFLGKNDPPPNNQCGYVSLAHPWGAGVVKWLSEEVLGIKPLEPGFKSFEIIPHLSASLSWVKGRTPTPHGTIIARFNLKTGTSVFTIPKGTFARRIAVPTGNHSVRKFYLNGKLVLVKGDASDTVLYSIADGYLNLKNLGPGRYTCRIIYKTGTSPAKPFSELAWKYSINTFQQDSSTSGNWKARYGKEGYLLFNYRKAGSDVEKLPAYLTSVTTKNAGNEHLELPLAGRTVLNDSTGSSKFLGAITTKDPEAMMQTMTLNLNVTDTRTHRIALYFLDWDSQERRSAVEIFDLKSLKLLAPVQEVKSYGKGKYLVFNYSGSVRIRINQIRGKNAALSGLFFDPIN